MIKKFENQYKFYTLISMAYLASIIASIIFFNKLIKLDMFFTSASLISYSFTYFFGNAISEVYGFVLARRLIWSSILCGNAFTIYCNFILKIPSPLIGNHDAQLSQVIGGDLRVGIAGTIAMLAGSYISVYIISKTKKFFLGQKYWIRNFFASSIGEAVNTLLVFPLGMYGLITNHELLSIILSAYFFKIIFVILQIIPSAFFVYFLENSERIPNNEEAPNYNPFAF